MTTPEKKKKSVESSAAIESAASKPTETERDELARLRRQVRTLEMECEFLKKAAVFFDKLPKRPSV